MYLFVNAGKCEREKIICSLHKMKTTFVNSQTSDYEMIYHTCFQCPEYVKGAPFDCKKFQSGIGNVKESQNFAGFSFTTNLTPAS